ncbi:MAG: class III lanthionine synthetase LanKC [Pseudonocardia sp.]
MDLGYERYCHADPIFYEAVEHWNDIQSRFAATHQAVPAGWDRFLRDGWVILHPSTQELPLQGWKIHVSACLGWAEDVLGVVWDYCLERNIAFKFLRSRDILLVENSKYAHRASSGKFLTLYPVDEVELHRTLTDLAIELAGSPGPYILSDLRWGSGPLYVRYGAFLQRHCASENGDLVPAIATPEGQLVPDLRRPIFQPPPWVDIPHFLAAQIAQRRHGSTENLPYEIEGALHFSNSGGVYLARDQRTGRRVVLKEARPHTGLDRDGTDAVTRLERERAMLEQLSGIGVAPEPVEHRVCWEHHFLVEEHIDGTPLNTAMVARYPLVRPDPSESEIVEYTAWALNVLRRVEQALDALHHRRIVFGDLHPRNIMLRPDGRVVFIDFETASHLEENRLPGLGAHGFAAPPTHSGLDIDLYALASLRLWMFLPLTPLLRKDPAKAQTFTRVLTERFTLPAAFAAEILRGLSVTERPRLPSPGQLSDPEKPDAVPIDVEHADWDTLRRSMTEAVLASATPQRPDRLFPGDVAQFRYGGLGLAYGAAGVLYALSTTGAAPQPEHVDWLIRATRKDSHPHPGLYNGLHGVAYVLDHLGRNDDALTTLDRALALTDTVRAVGLFGGLAGVGLNLLHFARATADPTLHNTTIGIAEQLARTVHDPATAPDRPSGAGLMYGFSGAALFFIHLHESTDDTTFLDLAAAAIRRDLAYCQTTDDGRFEVNDGRRLLPYVATGSAGIGLVLHEYLQHRDDEEFTSARARARRACETEFLVQAGLFNGRAGLIACLSRLSDPTGDASGTPALDRHLRRLLWHTVPYQEHVAFVGDQLLRLSMDLATGSAGILLALHTALDETHSFLPFLENRRTGNTPTCPERR